MIAWAPCDTINIRQDYVQSNLGNIGVKKVKSNGQLGILLLRPGWDDSTLQGFPRSLSPPPYNLYQPVIFQMNSLYVLEHKQIA